MKVILTSFIESEIIEADEYWSGARWAPSNYKDWPVARWAQPEDRDYGFAWKLREFGQDRNDMEKVNTYHGYALKEYRERYSEIVAWIDLLKERTTVVLACWCPFSNTSRKQLDRFGTFHCHLGTVEEVLRKCGLDTEFGPEHRTRMVRVDR